MSARAEKAADRIENAGALRDEKRRRNAFPGGVAEGHADTAVLHFNKVVEIAPHFPAGLTPPQDFEPVRPLDVVYVAPHEIHRFEASDDEALGFLCIVPRDRDRPVTVREPYG